MTKFDGTIFTIVLRSEVSTSVAMSTACDSICPLSAAPIWPGLIAKKTDVAITTAIMVVNIYVDSTFMPIFPSSDMSLN